MELNQIVNDKLVLIYNLIIKDEESLIKQFDSKLSLNEVHTLDAISKSSDKSMTYVANKIGITIGTLTSSINRLVSKGYVKRENDPKDKRKVLIDITSKANEVLLIHNEFHYSFIEKLLGCFEENQFSDISVYLDKITKVLKK